MFSKQSHFILDVSEEHVDLYLKQADFVIDMKSVHFEDSITPTNSVV